MTNNTNILDAETLYISNALVELSSKMQSDRSSDEIFTLKSRSKLNGRVSSPGQEVTWDLRYLLTFSFLFLITVYINLYCAHIKIK